MIAYFFPPCSASGVYRTVRFMKFLPDYEWYPIILTIKPDQYEAYFPLDLALTEQISPGQTIVRTSAFRWLDALLKLRQHIRVAKCASHSLKQQIDNSPKHSRWQRVKDSITGALSTPDEQIGWLLPALWRGMGIIRKQEVDAVYSTASPWTAHLIGYWLSRLTGTPWIADFRDPWTQNPFRAETSKLKESLEAFMEKCVVSRADIVIANTSTLREDFVRRYSFLNSDKFVTITNGFDPDENEPFRQSQRDEFDTPTATQSKDSTVFTLTHTGSLYGQRDPRPFFVAIEQLLMEGSIPMERLCINLVGESQDMVSRFLTDHPLVEKAVRLIPQVSHQKCLEYLVNSDLLLVIQPNTTLQIPGKLFEYIQVQKPILALTPSEGATARLITSDGIGASVDATDVVGIKKQVLLYYQMFLCGSLRTNHPSDIYRKYSMRQLTKQLANLLDKLANGKSGE